MYYSVTRIHRIGQKAKVCVIQFLVSDTPTMDQQLLSSINVKQKTLHSTTGISKDASGFHQTLPARQPGQVSDWQLRTLTAVRSSTPRGIYPCNAACFDV